jgi:hypothetical protein
MTDLATAPAPKTLTIQEADFSGLPPVVETYLRRAIPIDRALPSSIRLRQEGQFLLNGIWRRFHATEHYSVAPAEFLWEAKVRVAPLLDVHVRDGWTNGHGSLQAAVAGLLPIVKQAGGALLDTAALQRYLAEAPWLPIALLPCHGVRWQAIDENRARALLTDSGATADLEFTFRDGDAFSIYSAARGREVKGQYLPTPWRGRFWHYAERCGMRIPLEGEVEWIVDGRAEPYWRGRILGVDG